MSAPRTVGDRWPLRIPPLGRTLGNAPLPSQRAGVREIPIPTRGQRGARSIRAAPSLHSRRPDRRRSQPELFTHSDHTTLDGEHRQLLTRRRGQWSSTTSTVAAHNPSVTHALRGDRHWYTSKAFLAGVGVGCAATFLEKDEGVNGVTDAFISAALDGLIFVAIARGPRTIAWALRRALPVHSPGPRLSA